MSDPLRDIDDAVEREDSPAVLFWREEIELAKKRQKKYCEKAREVIRIYESEKLQENTFNILFSNTETLAPAVYNQLPRPIAERRFHDPDPMGKWASETIERTLSYLQDSPYQDYESYDTLWKKAVLGALVPGWGITWFRYDPTIKGPAKPLEDRAKDHSSTPEEEIADSQTATGVVLSDPEEEQSVEWETICGEDLDYDEFLCGYAKKWTRMPWVAREHQMTREDAQENFGATVAGRLSYTKGDGEEKDKYWKTDDPEQANRSASATACVYEIWWKTKRQVVFYSPDMKDQFCKDPTDDPYRLTGFFPCTEPLKFYKKLSSQVPTPVYEAYRTKAKELNIVSRRIDRILNAMKVRGFYDGSIQGLSELLSKDDNTLIPAKNVAAFYEGKTLENAVWFMPLDMLIGVLKELYPAQENCKQTIYEITGIADIMRGSSQVSETATAQNIKDKWGTLRLQNMQGAVQVYIRDSLRIVAELAGMHFGVETFAAMTNLPYALPDEVRQAQAAMQQVNEYLSMLPPPPMPQPQTPGSPPAPPSGPQGLAQLPAHMQQAVQQAQEVLAKPQWEQVVDLLRDSIQRSYRIDIETNSTLSTLNADDQKNIAEALGVIGQVMQQFVPAVQAGMMPMATVKEILLSVCRRFEFGRQVEAEIEKMPNQLPQQGPDPAQVQKMAEDVQKREQKVQQDEAQLETASKTLMGETKLAKQEITMERRMLDMEKKMATMEIQFTGKKVGMEIQQKELGLEMQQQERQFAAQEQERELEFAEREVGHDLDMKARDVEARQQQGQHKLAMQGQKNDQKAQQAAAKQKAQAAKAKGNGARK